MAELNLNGTQSGSDEDFDDSIIIVQVDQDKAGGVVLDTTGFADEYIHAGHGVIKQTSTGIYKPLAASDDATITAGHTAAGVVIATVPTARPAVGLMEQGKMNIKAAKYSLSSTFQSATQTGGLLINYTED